MNILRTNDNPDLFSLFKQCTGDNTCLSIRKHAFEQMYLRRISEEDLEEIIFKGKIIENYPDDYLLPSVLICGKIKTRIIRVIAAFNCEKKR